MSEFASDLVRDYASVAILAMAIIGSFAAGRIMELKRSLRDLNEHIEWLQSWGLDWRDIGLNLFVHEEGWSEELQEELKRVAERMKEEQARRRTNNARRG